MWVKTAGDLGARKEPHTARTDTLAAPSETGDGIKAPRFPKSRSLALHDCKKALSRPLHITRILLRGQPTVCLHRALNLDHRRYICFRKASITHSAEGKATSVPPAKRSLQGGRRTLRYAV